MTTKVGIRSLTTEPLDCQRESRLPSTTTGTLEAYSTPGAKKLGNVGCSGTQIRPGLCLCRFNPRNLKTDGDPRLK